MLAATIAGVAVAAAGVSVGIVVPVIRWWSGLPTNLLGQRRVRGRWVGRRR
ncbi:MAG TPA: hypothetical protein VN961_24830 [Streptosporangiaceae bacterium]|nr:hypothetical protein [Streptosporangiaceae bacterium]